MTTIFDIEWPVAPTEQNLYMQQIQQEITHLRNRQRKIEIISTTEPTQAEWEDAYTARTLLLPPISVGTKLCWINPLTQTVKMYTTTHDSETGTVNSGSIYQYPQFNRSKLPFRFIGKGVPFESAGVHSGFYLTPINSQSRHGKQQDSPTTKLLTNPFHWQQRNLDTLMVVFKLRVTGTLGSSDGLALNISAAKNTTGSPKPIGYRGIDPAGVDIRSLYFERNSASLTMAEDSETNPGLTARVSSAGTIPNNTSSHVSTQYLTGFLFLHNGLLRWDTDNDKDKIRRHAASAYGFYTSSPSSSALSTSTVRYGGFTLAKVQDTSVTTNGAVRFIQDSQTTQDWDSESRAWVYGFFENDNLDSELDDE